MAWLSLAVVVAVLLAVDLGVFHRRAHVVGMREAAAWSVVWLLVATAFGVGVWWARGAEAGLAFATAYTLEKALSVDNLFVMLLTLQAFNVPKVAYHRVLFWGVLGALLLRGVFIAAGAALLAHFAWLLGVFGVLLVLAGLKLLVTKPEAEVREGRVIGWLRARLQVREGAGAEFWVVADGRRFVTPVLLALVAVELSDVVFALDSIPAVFAVSQDPFIVFSSNVLAVLGLRSLFFVIEGLLARFHLLRFGLAAVLVFIGGKLLAAPVVHVPVAVSLVVVLGLLAASMLASLAFAQAGRSTPTQRPHGTRRHASL